MAKKYLESYGIWVNCEEDETVGSVPTEQQIDNIESGSSEVKTEITASGDVNQEVVATEEDLEEVQDTLEEQADENDQLIEEKPEEVTEEVVQQSNETFLLCLGRLGFGTRDLRRLQLGFESYNTPLENLKTTNKSIRNVIRQIKNVKKRKISKEYTAVDWTKLIFGSVAGLGRMLFVWKKATIQNPGVLISFMLSKKTYALDVVTTLRSLTSFIYGGLASTSTYGMMKMGEIASGEKIATGTKLAASAVAGLLGSSASVIESGIGMTVKELIDRIKSKGGKTHLFDKLFNNHNPDDIPNMYYNLIIDTQSVINRDINDVKNNVEAFKNFILTLKATVCSKGESYTLSSSQLSDIKKFRPDAAAKEMAEASQYASSVSPELQKVIDDFVLWWKSEVIDYLASDIK